MELFNYRGALEINRARIQHLDTLKLNFANKSVLETGCGGKGDITRYLLSKNAIVTLNDYRQENIMSLMNALQRRLEFNTWDLNKPLMLKNDKKFDIIICYGTLYHLNKPADAIRHLSQSCNEFIVLSTCTNGQNDRSVNVTKEDIGANNQAGDGFGCRPGRLFLYETLRNNFNFVYCVKTQPRHKDFPLKFPTNTNPYARNVMIGSHIRLENDLLTDEFISEFTNNE
jgi:SAM-dependent methyltransferase